MANGRTGLESGATSETHFNMIRWAENWIVCHNNKSVRRRCAFEARRMELLLIWRTREKKLISITLLSHFWDLNSVVFFTRANNLDKLASVYRKFKSHVPHLTRSSICLICSYLAPSSSITRLRHCLSLLPCKISSNLQNGGRWRARGAWEARSEMQNYLATPRERRLKN